MSIGVHDTIYFDKIERTNKLQTLVAIANASLNIKNKEEVKKQLEYALNIFKIPKSESELGSGSYVGTQKQWNSKYTLSRDLGLVEESKKEIVLSKLGVSLAKGDISAKYYISVVMLNYIHIINNKVINPVYSIINTMKEKNVSELTKDELKNIKDFNLNGNDENNYIGGLFDLLQDTYYFKAKEKNILSINSDIFKLDDIKQVINLSQLNINVEEVKEKYSKDNQKQWCEYLGTENFKFKKMLLNLKENKKIINNNEKKYTNKANNRIVFGAPGTGKSYRIKGDIKELEEEKGLKDFYRRVTFHPNYTYSQFVGSYKPVSKANESTNEKEVIYEFVSGPFLKVLVDSLKDEKEGKPHLLVIEEINRANPAAVFGDIFQLLDRNEDGESSYKITVSKEMREFLQSKDGLADRFNEILGENSEEIYIPNNMYIWATMNSADQGVYPMDSAFKRRWSFEYIGIDENEEELESKEYNIIKLKNGPKDNDYGTYSWNAVRKEINNNLKKLKVNEDKLLGPFFLSEIELSKSQVAQVEFDNIFKSKVLMYLYEDILKHKKGEFFATDDLTLSGIMKSYNEGHFFSFSLNEIYKDDNASEEENEVEFKV